MHKIAIFCLLFVIPFLKIQAYAATENEIETSKMEVQGHSDEELCDMAREYYQYMNPDALVLPRLVVDVDHTEGDTVLLHLYEVVDNHTATYDWYTINRNTASGTDFLEIKLISQLLFQQKPTIAHLQIFPQMSYLQNHLLNTAMKLLFWRPI